MEKIAWKLWPFYIIAAGAVLLIITRIAWDKVNRGFDNTSLILFAIASVALLLPFALPRIKRIKVSDTEVEFKELEEELPKVAPGGNVVPSTDTRLKLESGDEWNDYRHKVKERSRDVFLAHVIKPADIPGQKYDIYVFLIRAKSSNLEDVGYAEFFFGRYWGNNVFRVTNEGGKLGVSTSAYGPFLCICRVTFKDGYQAYIERFIDFEMGRVFEKTAT
jgi:hypothetical protein